jgi:glycogen debranching enzyme
MDIDATRVARLRTQSFELLAHNRRVHDGHQFTVPSPQSYPFQWLWDSCFHAIVLAYESPNDAKEEIRSLFSGQFDNGMLPHMIYRGEGDQMKLGDGFTRIEWGKEKTSTITQPPIIAEAVWKIYERDGDIGFLTETYQKMGDFFEYLLSARDPRGNHLAGIINPDESGEDNSPRFDSVLGLPPVQTLQENFSSRLRLVEELRKGHFDAPFMKQYFWVKDVPFNAILVRGLRTMARIAERLEKPLDAERYGHQADLVSHAMRERMYDDELFWPTYGESYLKIKLKTWAIFAPMYAHVLSQGEARKLVDDHLLNPHEFRLRYMVPTVAMTEPSYDPDGFWRGPTWIGVNWFVFHGLLNYGYHDVAERVLESSVELLERSGFREYYNPDTGAGLGALDFTWGTLVVDMFEALAKYEQKAP